MDANEFEKRMIALFPGGIPAAMSNWTDYANSLEQDNTCPKAKFFTELYVELGMVKQHFGMEIALQLFNLAESSCLNPFEVRGAANLLKDGIPISEIMDLAIAGKCDRTPEEYRESEEALAAFYKNQFEYLDAANVAPHEEWRQFKEPDIIGRNDNDMNDNVTGIVPEDTGTSEPLKLDVSVRPITPKNNLLAFASVKIADCFVVDNIKIVAGEKGLYVNMPSAQDGKGKFHDVAYPITADFRQQLQTAILDSYGAAVEKVQGIGAAQREFTEKPSIKDQLKDGAKASAERAAAPKMPDAPKRGDNSL